MRNYPSAIASFVLAALVVSGFAKARSSPQTATRTVIGRVIDAGTVQGLSSVNVMAPSQRIGTRTKANGDFRLSDVPEGVMRIELRHPCYYSVQVTIPAIGDVELEVGLPFDRASLQRAGCGGLGARKK